jgi:hypothetical protein
LYLLTRVEPTLRQVANLLTLGIREIELGQWQSEIPGAARAAATGAPAGSARSTRGAVLRECETSREQDRHQSAGRQGTKSSHENLHMPAGNADFWLIGRYASWRPHGQAVKIV